jgi:hypothetical protein
MHYIHKTSQNTGIFIHDDCDPPAAESLASTIGIKAYNLIVCDKNILPIPKTLVCATESIAVQSNHEILTKTCLEYVGPLPYIIRSSYPTEDGEKESNAGRFLSRICHGDIVDTILEIQHHAQSTNAYLPFYVIIQPYILAAESGILCTLDPLLSVW